MTTPQLGDVLVDRYRLDAVLGEGGFGLVYRAFDLSLARTVALKLLKPGRDGHDPQARARFAREAALVSRLRAPGIATLYAHGETPDGVPFTVFELVEGRDLSELLPAAGHLPAADVEHILRQLLEALQHAHAAGVLHRDLKPSNVRVFEQYGDPLRVKLIDFGIARSLDHVSPSVTATGELIGTPRFMSPEQLTGAELTPASDLYSLGLVALYLLGDRRGGDRWNDQLERLREGHVFDLPEAIRPALAQVLRRLVARNAADRFPSAAAALAALGPPGADAYPRPLPAEAPDEVRAPPSRSVRAAIGAALLMVLFAASGIMLWTRRAPPTPGPSNPDLHAPRRLPGIVAAHAGDADVVGSGAGLPAQSGCGAPPFSGIARLGGVGETWLTYIPSSYGSAGPRPLVVLLHQTLETPERLLRASRFAEHAERSGWVVIVPESDQVETWPAHRGARDVERIVAFTSDELCIDRTRIYLVGNGIGGDLAHQLACEPWVAAVATNGSRSVRGTQPCAQAKPTMLVNPLHSRRKPAEGGRGDCRLTSREEYKSIAEDTDAFKARNGCKGPRHVSFEYEGSRCSAWDCQTPFHTCEVAGGHYWPGSPRPNVEGCDGVDPDFPTGDRIWAFLESLEPRDGQADAP